MSETQPSASQRPASQGLPDVELLQAVLTKARVPPNWDILLVTDGSGSGWSGCAGWAATLIESTSRGRRLFYGAANVGSVNFAETMPVLQPINWYDMVGGGKERLRTIGVLRVHIITDSQVIARWGTQAANLGQSVPRKHAAFYAGLRELGRLGYCFNFHWAGRSTSLLNWTADLLAGLARHQIKELNPETNIGSLADQAALALAGVSFADPTTQEAINIYDLNPDELV